MLRPNVVYAPDDGSGGGQPSDAEGETVAGEQSIEETVAKLAKKVDQLSGDRDGTYSKLDKTEAELKSIRDSLEGISTKLGEEAQPSSDGLVDQLAKLGEKLDTLTQTPEENSGGLANAQKLATNLGLDLNDPKVLEAVVNNQNDASALQESLLAIKSSLVSQATPAEVPQAAGSGSAPTPPSGDTMSEAQFQAGLQKIMEDIPFTQMDERHKAIAALKNEATSKGLPKT